MHSPLLSLLTTTAVVLHALLGCCGHHSHADQGLQCEKAPQSVPSCCGCQNGAAASSSSDAEPTGGEGHRGHGHDEPCNGPECQFVGVERVDDVEQALSLPLWLPLNGAQYVLAGNCAASGTVTDEPGRHTSSTGPVRAATQVWLL